MQSKLHIDLINGVVIVEGDTELVKLVYEDFKDQLVINTNHAKPTARHTEQESTSESTSPKTKRRSPTRKKIVANDASVGNINPDHPKRDKDLNTAKLMEFYQQFSPSNAPEKILIFLKFMNENLNIEHPNTDQFYTCLLEVKEKPPAAFAQAFRDTAAKKGYINFTSAEDITITTKGNNHFEFDLKKKEPE